MCDEQRWPFFQSICVSCFGKYLKSFLVLMTVAMLFGCAAKKPVYAVLPSEFKAAKCTVSHRSIQGIPTRLDCAKPAVKNCQVTEWQDGDASRCYCGNPQESIDAKTGAVTVFCSD